jgi:hypothetical protein
VKEHSRGLDLNYILPSIFLIGTFKEVKGIFLGWKHLNCNIFEKEGLIKVS